MASSTALLSGSAIQSGAGLSVKSARGPSTPLPSSSFLLAAHTFMPRRHAHRSARRPVSIRAQDVETKEPTLTGVVFEPFQEVQGLVKSVPETSKESFARQRFSQASEAGINEQIK
jgi:hypothetical protein